MAINKTTNKLHPIVFLEHPEALFCLITMKHLNSNNLKLFPYYSCPTYLVIVLTAKAFSNNKLTNRHENCKQLEPLKFSSMNLFSKGICN